uniref:IP16135p n=1 Tax=Drosophila melanogaster TaxID=7227 RepID=Q1EBX2_DROME|nr:IP16135p [Drosophila melanogaster]
MVQRASSSDAPSVQGGQHRESRFGLGYPSYQSGYTIHTGATNNQTSRGGGDPNPCSLMRFSDECHGFCNLIYSKTFNLKSDLKIPLT